MSNRKHITKILFVALLLAVQTSPAFAIDTYSGLDEFSEKYDMTPNFVVDADDYGVRGGIMFGQTNDTYGWKFGPFVRYMNVNESGIQQRSAASWAEPSNMRIQAGVGLKFNY